jgi:hypothetical protein
MGDIITKLMEVISLEYSFSVIIATFLVLKTVDLLNGERVLRTIWKQIITMVVGVIMFVVFRKYTTVPTQTLIASYFFAIFVYDVAIKTLLRKLRAGYREC